MTGDDENPLADEEDQFPKVTVLEQGVHFPKLGVGHDATLGFLLEGVGDPGPRRVIEKPKIEPWWSRTPRHNSRPIASGRLSIL